MKKLLIILSILFGLNSISANVLAEVNIDLLKQKYATCEDVTYRHECFDRFEESDWVRVGLFKNNGLWHGNFYHNNILTHEVINGKLISKSSCSKSNDGWISCPSGSRYKPIENGYFDKNNKRQGKFIYEYSGGSVYIGEFRDNYRSGFGIYTYFSGDKYEGEYKKNKKHGQGTYTFLNGVKDTGQYKFGSLNGFATRYDKDGNVLKEGIWKNDKFLYSQKKPTPTSNSKLEEYKNFCSEIGFTPGTEKYGDCVVEAMKKG